MRGCVLAVYIVAAGILNANAVAADKTTKTEQTKQEQANVEQTTKGWHHSYVKAYREAQRSGKPLVVHFHTEWCGACVQMESTVLDSHAVGRTLGRTIVGVKIDADRFPDLVKGFRISGYPADVFVAPTGKVLFYGGVAYSPQTYLTQIARAAKAVAARKTVQRGHAPRDPGARPALKGYSPVSITDEKKWQKGKREFAWEVDGVVYLMRNAAELKQFQANPERYTPGLLGYDPLLLQSSRQAVPGDIRYAAFYRERLYLLASSENRRRFIDDPRKYTQAVSLSEINDLSQPQVVME